MMRTARRPNIVNDQTMSTMCVTDVCMGFDSGRAPLVEMNDEGGEGCLLASS